MAERKLVALTFDDGPTLGITDKVLDVLEENNVVASFFLIGQNITEQTEYLVKRAYNMLHDREPFQDTSIHDRSDKTGDPG